MGLAWYFGARFDLAFGQLFDGVRQLRNSIAGSSTSSVAENMPSKIPHPDEL